MFIYVWISIILILIHTRFTYLFDGFINFLNFIQAIYSLCVICMILFLNIVIKHNMFNTFAIGDTSMFVCLTWDNEPWRRAHFALKVLTMAFSFLIFWSSIFFHIHFLFICNNFLVPLVSWFGSIFAIIWKEHKKNKGNN